MVDAAILDPDKIKKNLRRKNLRKKLLILPHVLEIKV